MGRCVIAATNFKQLGNYVGDIIIRYQFIYIVIDRRRILGQQIHTKHPGRIVNKWWERCKGRQDGLTTTDRPTDIHRADG